MVVLERFSSTGIDIFLVTVSVTMFVLQVRVVSPKLDPLDSEGQWFSVRVFLPLATGSSYFKAPDARLLPLSFSYISITRATTWRCDM